MYLHPFNRHLLIDLVGPAEEESADSSAVLLPEDYQKKVDKFVVAEIVDVADDCTLSLLEGDFIVIDGPMVEEIKLRGETFNLILENYVYGRMGGEEETFDLEQETFDLNDE